MTLDFEEDVRIETVPLLGQFFDDRFSHAVRVTHLPTNTMVYRSPFDFPEPKLRDELIERALSELRVEVRKRLEKRATC